MSQLDNLQQINTNTPRETLVYNADGLVIKRPVQGNLPPAVWLDKQRYAQSVMAELGAVKSNAYYVPKMLEISSQELFAIETRVYGHPINSSYFDGLTSTDHDIIYNAVAHFMNDMNQMRPVLPQQDILDTNIDGHASEMSFVAVLTGMKEHLNPTEIENVQRAKEWFDTASKNDANIVFSHGDMNENNIFYDATNQCVSFIDFADAKYENAHYMFERDFGKLGWLDLDRLRQEYMALPRKQPVIITSDRAIESMRNALQNFKWTSMEFLKNPKVAPKVRLTLIREYIESINKIYMTHGQSEKFADGKRNVANLKRKDVTNRSICDNKSKER